MAPVGSFDSLMAAIKAGAHSVYFGIEQLNMRARSVNNFTLEELDQIVKICKENNVKTYLTLNIVMYDHDLVLMKKICDAAKKFGVNAVIASDVSVMVYANSINLSVHCSTQANISNIEAVKFYAQFVDLVVLARELNLQQIEAICTTIKKEQIKGPGGDLVKVEIFVHGALCVAISGKCSMSLATYNASANRGACLQNCRRSYKVTDEETGDELVIDNSYVMSPKDLCTIMFLDKILKTGVDVLKIEGRGKSPEYVFTVTTCYREALDCFFNGTYTQEKVKVWMKELEKVYNRGFWEGGYYLGKKLGEWSGVYGSKATEEKFFLGIVKNYYTDSKIIEFNLQAGTLHLGDEVLFIGPTTGVVKNKISFMRVNDLEGSSASKGDNVTFKLLEKVRRNDKVYVLKKNG